MSFPFPDLRRPQYPSSPEVLLSALAWSVVPRSPDHKNTGLIYVRKPSHAERKVKIKATRPGGATPEGVTLEEFARELRANGMRAGDGTLPQYAAEAVTDSLLGVQPLKGIGTASSAIGVAGALLQDPIGGLAAANPPNFALLLNTMHALGGPAGPTAAARWFSAARHYAQGTRMSTIERALTATALKPYLAPGWSITDGPAETGSAAPADVPAWWERDISAAGIGTPFSWYRTSWDRLCSPEWYKVLPPRRWAGWAVCILRNALGFGFLWEANFYFELARGIMDPSRDAATVAQWAVRPTKPLVPYRKGGIAQMDVMPSLKQLLGKGLACRNAVQAAAQALTSTPTTLAGLVRALRTEAADATRDRLHAALGGGGEKAGLNNLVETVRYSLLARGTSEVQDHNSLLRVVSRNYTHVVPGPEWIVVMSAMSAASPTAVVRLGDVRRSLDDLGFKPRIDFILNELERAGLCASAPDGDEGIEINLGFSGARS
jgi:hypothetical protein